MQGVRPSVQPKPATDCSFSASDEVSILELHLQKQLEEDIASDAYTECNINYQENEIITYLNGNLKKSNPNEDPGELEEFLTPKCISPYVEKDFLKPVSSSPSTELTKEYYALVPIEGNILDKELVEQDALLSAFNSIKKSQIHKSNKIKPNNTTCIKPTTLYLDINVSKTLEHSTSCDNLNNQLESNDKVSEANFSPDSLITDEPSSSSDYLSAAYTFSPGIISSGFCVHLNTEDNILKKEIITSSDSGLLESETSRIDITMADLSLNEQDLVTSKSHDVNTVSSQSKEINKSSDNDPSTELNSSIDSDINGAKNHRITETTSKSSKEEKQRQNEEIVILESSSLSSETGSWESVFPPRVSERDVCEQFINNERQNYGEKFNHLKNTSAATETTSSIPKSPQKSTSCFIDAASLADEESDLIIINETSIIEISDESHCSKKQDLSPNDWSESIIEDSLEQSKNKNSNSVTQSQLSPTIYEMVKSKGLLADKHKHEDIAKTKVIKAGFFISTSTPNNSLKAFKFDSDDEVTMNSSDNLKKCTKFSETIPVLSGGASVDDHLPVSTFSPLGRRKSENVPIISGAFTPKPEKTYTSKSPKPSCAETWTVDMTTTVENKCEEIESEKLIEKKNIFSMFIDLGQKSNVKQMPARLSASLNMKKNNHVELKTTSKNNTIPESRQVSTSGIMNITDVTQTTVDTSDFENYETLCENPNITVSEIIALPKKKLGVMSKQTTENPGTGDERPRNSAMSVNQFIKDVKTDQAPKKVSSKEYTVQKQTNHNDLNVRKESAAERGKTIPHKEYLACCNEDIQEQDTSASGLFVKLSDLDKPSQKIDIAVNNNSEKVMDMRMTRSIPENNWGGQHYNAAPISADVISSFHSENALSLNRLFPHLQNEFSRSMPGSLSSRTRSPQRLGYSSSIGDADEQASDMSELSSVQSSACRSVIGFTTTEESSQTSSIIYNCQSRLGQDLLRMFLEEIAPDVIVEVSGRRIRAHKCILSSRCQYFAGILSGGWVESAGNVILLPPFAYNVVHFALCHIYSGTSSIPDTISIVELTTLADMLGLEGLKEAIMFTLKSRYCHHFHRPCPVCVAGVLECFPLSSLCGLDDLYHKCLRWITKHFSTVWPTRAFAALPADLLDRCYQQHVINFTVETLADIVTGAGLSLMTLSISGRECDTVERLCRRLINAAGQFAAAQLVPVMRAVGPLPADMPTCAMRALDDCLTTAINCAHPDEICRAYAYIFSVLREMRLQNQTKPDLLSNSTQNIRTPEQNTILYTRISSWLRQCEQALQSPPRVIGLQVYMDVSPDIRRRLRDLGCIIYGTPAAPSMPDQRHRNYIDQRNRNRARAHNVDIDHMRASFVPYSPKPTTTREGLKLDSEIRDLQKSPKMSVPKIKMTKAQEERAKFNLAKHALINDRTNKMTDKISANAKPRCLLEPVIRVPSRIYKDVNAKIAPTKLNRVMSSSESSTSPLGTRGSLKSRQTNEAKGQAMSQDSLATSSRPRTAEPSTESLSESQASNKYATYTKIKHASKGSVESVQTSKSREPMNSYRTSKGITKIPVLKTTGTKPKLTENKTTTDMPKKNSHAGTSTSVAQPAARVKSERKAPRSLMNATKSSSAKVVQRIVKETPSKVTTRRPKRTAKTNNEESPDIPPAMDRSGTFLKDEPTFGDKTTNLDIDQ